jgi:hypothetical protein
MITYSQKGAERPTLFERFADRLPLPYPWLCLILAVIPGYGASNFGQNLVDWWLWSLLAFYMFYIIRYMRMRVLKSKWEIVPLCPDGEDTFRKAFGRLSHLAGQILSMFAMVSLAIFYFLRLFRVADFFHLTFAVSTVLLFGVAFGSGFWVYLSSLTGVYDLGKNPLKLKSFYEDAMLGVRPLGSLSLQLTIVYLGLSGVAALATAFFPDIVSISLLSGLTVLGVVLFFYPLTGIHRLMQQEKDREHALIRRELSDLVQKPKQQVPHSIDTTLADLELLFRDFRSLLALDLSERKVLSVPTWPYDSKILSELTIVIISVTATIVAQIIIVALHL